MFTVAAIDLVETYFQMPVLPFSGLLCLVTLYWLMVILGGIDLDLFDIDFDMDLDVDADVSPSFTDFGLLGLKWLNIGEIPFMIWLSIVALCSWLVAMVFDRGGDAPSTQESTIAILRSLAIGIVATKVLTNPMRGKLRMKQPNTVQDLLGQTCSVVTSEVTTTFGNAVCHVDDGAPLRLNVRTLDGSIPKNAIVQIIDYVPETGIYYVKDTGERVGSV